MKIEIINCGNIEHAKLNVRKGQKTIMIANNGTGKSTITKAIKRHILNESLDDLKSFSSKIIGLPSVVMNYVPQSVLVFDEEFPLEFVFVGDKLMDSDISYELLLEDENIKKIKKSITEKIYELNSFVRDNLSPLKKDFNAFAKIAKDNSSTRNQKKFVPMKRYEGLHDKNPLGNISSFKIYRKILSNISSRNAWFTWLKSQDTIINNSEILCPYCEQNIDESLKNRIASFKDEFNIGAIKNREEVKVILEKISKISELNLSAIINVVDAGSRVESKTVNRKIYRELESVRDIIDEIEKLESLTINEIYNINTTFSLEHINITAFKELKLYDELLVKFEKIKTESSSLKKNIGIMNSRLKGALRQNKEILNEFCQATGIPYYFDIREFKNKNSMVMCYAGKKSEIEKPDQKLSFGEKNALSSIIFGLIAKQQNTEFIIIDDPFSSFDQYKSHYIYTKLFQGRGALLKGKTVLYTTHSLDPVIDLIYNNKPTRFDLCLSLENSKGKIKVNEIKKSHILSFKNALIDRIENNDIDIIKLLYIRKLIEVLESTHGNGKDNNYYYAYHYISSYTKGLEPKIKLDKSYTLMTNEEVNMSKENIEKFCREYKLNTFEIHSNDQSFLKIITKYTNLKSLEDKLIFMRYLLQRDKNKEDDIFDEDKSLIKYFLDLVYHFDNDRLLYVDKEKYSELPNYVGDIADDYFIKMNQHYSNLEQ